MYADTYMLNLCGWVRNAKNFCLAFFYFVFQYHGIFFFPGFRDFLIFGNLKIAYIIWEFCILLWRFWKAVELFYSNAFAIENVFCVLNEKLVMAVDMSQYTSHHTVPHTKTFQPSRFKNQDRDWNSGMRSREVPCANAPSLHYHPLTAKKV